MTKAELNELKRSTKADLIQLIQDQTDNLQAFYEEIERLKFSAGVNDGFIEWLKEENKKLRKENSEDRKKLCREIAELQILHSPKEYMSFDRTKYFGKLSICGNSFTTNGKM